MSSFDPKTRLKEYHILLRQVLTDIHNNVSFKLGVNDSQHSTSTIALNNTDYEISLLQANIKETKERLQFLRIPGVLVAQPIEGNSSQAHTHKRLRPTPNFHFNLTAPFPIRGHETFQSEGSVWKSKMCTEGGTTFSGEAKTKAFKDANASVVLYGWRHEMRASEIAQLDDAATNLASVLDELERDAKKSNAELKALLKHRSGLQGELDINTQDLQIVAGYDARTGMSAEVAEILSIGSVSQLAVHYKLLTNVSQVEDGAPALSSATTWMFSAFEREIQHAWMAMEDMMVTYVDCCSHTQINSQNFLLELYGLSSNKFTVDQLQRAKTSIASKKIALNESSKLDALSRAATEDLDVLETDLGCVVTELDFAATKVENMTNSRREAESWSIQLALKKSMEVTEIEQQTRKDAVVAVMDDKRHVGVVAALRSSPNSSDAWMSVYRGRREEAVYVC